MRLSLHCVGGFTGPAGAQTRDVDVDSLPAAKGTRVRGLVQALDLAQLPPTLLKPRPQSWDFTYTLTIDDGTPRQVRFHLDAAPPALRELVEFIERT
ncbi:protealysin inhibitor emfourin [Massilia sp. Root335]|jgi:hypothetical protein|uniref:protealysin inhibitor emfourin n=1 Tax=Massilia sp. Root335 TaxID=1736517 RepID=UPI0006FDFF92|nr:protealysin inhibitor emfourin [Massilia sp. Root335]KQV50134.1 hypothetical protein ASC93_11485 [Massilia sp. Root335]